MSDSIKVLIVEDSDDDAQLLVRELKRNGFDFVWKRVDSCQDLEESLEKNQWDLVLSDFHLPGFTAVQVLQIVKHIQADLPFIVVSGTIGEESAVELMRLGAHDYVLKGKLTRLPEAIRRELREAELRAERKLAADQLAQTEARLQLTIEGSGIGIWDWFIDSDQFVFNEQIADLLGHPFDPMSPTSLSQWHQNIHPQDAIKVRETLSAHLKGIVPIYECEIRIQQSSGDWVWVLDRGKVVQRDSLGIPIRMTGTYLNINTRKLAEINLQQLNSELEKRVEERTSLLLERENQLQDFFDSANDLIQSISLETGNLEYVNKAWSETLGFPNDEYKNINIIDILHPSSVPFFQKILESFRSGTINCINDCEVIFITKDHKQVVVEGSVNCRIINDFPVSARAIFRDITSRKIVEASLLESESTNRAIIQAIPDLLLKMDIHGAYHHVLGLGRNKYFSLNPNNGVPSFFDALSPEASDQLNEFLYKAIDEHEIQIYEQQILVEGEVISEEVRIVPLNTQEVLVMVRDITDRKRAEENLLESQQFLQTVLDTVPLSVFWKNVRSVYIGCNQNFALSVGLPSQNDIIGKSDYDLHWPQDKADLNFQEDQFLLKTETPLIGVIETQIQPDGSFSWIECNKIPLRNSKGKIIGILGTYKDVTERFLAEKQLKQQLQEARLHASLSQHIKLSLKQDKIYNTVVNQVRRFLKVERTLICELFDEGTCSVVAESKLPDLLKINPSSWDVDATQSVFRDFLLKGIIKKIYNSSTDEAATQFPFLSFDPFESSAIIIPIMQRVINSNKRWANQKGDYRLWGFLCTYSSYANRAWQKSEVMLLKQIANQLSISIQQSALFEQVQSELIERKQAESALLKANELLTLLNHELTVATQLKDEFLANMSHELRTPLNAILGMAEILQDQITGTLNDRQLAHVNTIEGSGRHLLDLINDILDLAKIEAGKMELFITQVDISAFCGYTLNFVRQLATNKRIYLCSEISQDLGVLKGDERRIRQALINLLSNAIKFTHEGGQITFEAKLETPDTVAFSVTDTGIGISQDHINKLFQPFTQIDSNLNRQYNGTGLGLALVKRIAELHQGSISVKSELNKGSCFTLRLPYFPQTNPPSLPTPQCKWDPLVSDNNLKIGAGVILIAEDNPANIESLTDYLQSKGYEIIVANDGFQVLDVLTQCQPHIIIMDIQMPLMDGIEATRRIRDNPNWVTIPIIALTALAMPGDRERCIEAGVNEFLTKPVRLKQLADRIQQILLQT